MDVPKTCDCIRQKYFWPNLLKEIYQYVSSCTTCQTRFLQKIRQLLQETDIPPYPMAKWSIDLSGPYLQRCLTISISLLLLTGLVVGLLLSQSLIRQLLFEEIFPRFGCPLQIVTDNGSENVNKVVRETSESLNIHHILTSVYHPQNNAKVERFHRTLHDILAKKLSENQRT